LLSPAKQRIAVEYAKTTLEVSERQACRALSVNRNTIRSAGDKKEKDAEIRKKIVALAERYGRVGYRMITSMLRNDGEIVNHKKVERIWREEGLKLPQKQPQKRRLWLADSSCVRLKAERQNHVWSYDFVEEKTVDGRRARILNIIDEYTRECLASIPRRSWKDGAVIEVLANLMFQHGIPEYIRSDNGSEFSNKRIRKWLDKAGVITAFIEPGSPWENGYIESFNSRMRDEFLNGEIFGNMYELKILIDRWIRYYNEIRPHSSLGGKPPAPRVLIPVAG